MHFLDPFESDIEFEILEKFPANKRFNINFWKNENSLSKDLVIMINGFLDGVDPDPRRRKLFLKRYSDIAEKLISQNVNCALLPMPFHFERCEDLSADGSFAPIERLKENGTFLYYGGYTQVISDLEKLIGKIQKEPNKYGLKDDKFNIHLIGYSLGGVAAAGAVHELKEKIKFKSLTIYLSALNISNINPEAIENTFNGKIKYGFGKKEWNKMLKQLKSITSNDIFNYLIWGTGDDPRTDEKVERILFIHGKNDVIFDKKFSTDLSKKLIGKSSYQNATYLFLPTDHAAMKNTATIGGYITNFIIQK